MKIERRSTLVGAREARGIVVVIDVLRAFTCAAMMLRYGVSELVLVATAEEAVALRLVDPSWLIAGEIGGKQVEGFDLWNSPAEIARKGESYFRQRKVALRSSSGVQGAIAVKDSVQEIIVTGYSTASAVARYIRSKEDKDLLVTVLGMGSEGKHKSIEDEFCGDYIEHLLTNTAYDHLSAVWECLHHPAISNSFRGEQPCMPVEDVVLSLQRDLFDFVMVGKPAGNTVVVRPIAV
jgi:2-phosphosulfolactate phosphatase